MGIDAVIIGGLILAGGVFVLWQNKVNRDGVKSETDKLNKKIDAVADAVKDAVKDLK